MNVNVGEGGWGVMRFCPLWSGQRPPTTTGASQRKAENDMTTTILDHLHSALITEERESGSAAKLAISVYGWRHHRTLELVRSHEHAKSVLDHYETFGSLPTSIEETNDPVGIK